MKTGKVNIYFLFKSVFPISPFSLASNFSFYEIWRKKYLLSHLHVFSTIWAKRTSVYCICLTSAKIALKFNAFCLNGKKFAKFRQAHKSYLINPLLWLQCKQNAETEKREKRFFIYYTLSDVYIQRYGEWLAFEFVILR